MKATQKKRELDQAEYLHQQLLTQRGQLDAHLQLLEKQMNSMQVDVCRDRKSNFVGSHFGHAVGQRAAGPVERPRDE